MRQQETAKKKQIVPANVWALLSIAVILATFFRFFRLTQTPPGFMFDEASHALDALDIMRGQLMLLSPRLDETAAGYMYFLAGAFQFFGASVPVHRAVTAIFGVLLIPVTFFAAQTLFNKESGQKAAWIAVFSALLPATSFWGITVSRIGFEYIPPLVFALAGLVFFWRGYQDEHWGLLLVAGILTAAEFYLYHASAPFLLVIPTAVVLNWLLSKILPKSPVAQSPVRWKALLFFCLVVAIIDLPLFLALTTGASPEVARSVQLSFFGRATGPAHFVQLLAGSLIAHAKPFLALGGDDRWYANLPERPILDPILAISFVAGTLISLKRIKQLPYLFLLVYWGAMLSPAILTVASSGSPRYFRMTGALPPTYILVSLAWAELYCRLKAWLATSVRADLQKSAPWLALAPFLLVSLIWLPVNTYRDYFLLWANHPQVAFYHDAPIVRLVERMENESDSEALFILPRKATNPRPNYTIDFLYHGSAGFLYLPVDEATVRPTLTVKLSNYQTVHLIANLVSGREKAQRNADPGAILPLLFNRHGQLLETEETDDYTIQTYRLNSNHVDFESHLQTGTPPEFKPLSFVIGDKLKLAGINQRLENNDLFIDLAWQGWTKVVNDYTVFIQLLDNDGNRVAGVDLLPERGFTTLDRQEVMITHYSIPLSDQMRPGAYAVLVGLYYFAGDQLINIGSATLDEALILE